MKKKTMEDKKPEVRDEKVEKSLSESQPKAPEPKAEDRSAYNCGNCKGEGLNSLGRVCQDCKGTGKV